jgi:hypothetical protein
MGLGAVYSQMILILHVLFISLKAGFSYPREANENKPSKQLLNNLADSL